MVWFIRWSLNLTQKNHDQLWRKVDEACQISIQKRTNFLLWRFFSWRLMIHDFKNRSEWIVYDQIISFRFWWSPRWCDQRARLRSLFCRFDRLIDFVTSLFWYCSLLTCSYSFIWLGSVRKLFWLIWNWIWFSHSSGPAMFFYELL